MATESCDPVSRRAPRQHLPTRVVKSLPWLWHSMTPPMRGFPACCRLRMICLPCWYHAHLKGSSASLLLCCNLALRDSAPSCIAWCRLFSHPPPWGLAHWAATATRAVAVHLFPICALTQGDVAGRVMGDHFETQPSHTRQKYEKKYGPKIVKFAVFGF